MVTFNSNFIWHFRTDDNINHNLTSCLFLNTRQKPRKLCKFFCISFKAADCGRNSRVNFA